MRAGVSDISEDRYLPTLIVNFSDLWSNGSMITISL